MALAGFSSVGSIELIQKKAPTEMSNQPSPTKALVRSETPAQKGADSDEFLPVSPNHFNMLHSLVSRFGTLMVRRYSKPKGIGYRSVGMAAKS